MVFSVFSSTLHFSYGRSRGVIGEIFWSFKMRKVGHFLLILLLLVSPVFAQDQWNCQTPGCVGHKAGYDWAASRPVTEEDCNTAGEHYNSPSFAEGCKTAIVFKQQWASTREMLTSIFQAYALGQQLAKEGRSLPNGCQSAYSSMTSPDSSVKVDTLLAMKFRDGCLQVANKASLLDVGLAGQAGSTKSVTALSDAEPPAPRYDSADDRGMAL
jgi:hypothetical protein